MKSRANKDINLQDLKYMEAIDKKEQGVIKNYIDDLVFSLYFNIPIKKSDLKDAIKIKDLCMKNDFYNYINQ